MKFLSKKIGLIMACMIITINLSACSEKSLTRYQAGFFDAFDTYISFIIYAESEAAFNDHFEAARAEFIKYHILFDIFNSYDGINNLHTVNENAGIKPVTVEREIIDLLIFSKQAYIDSGGILNVTLGPVLSIWHSYRTHGLLNPKSAAIPDYYVLREAFGFVNINGLIIDEQNNTVFLAEEGMSLDVGATAKSFAAGRIAELLIQRGVRSAVVNAGGDIVVIGEAASGGGRPWNIGIKDPQTGGTLDSVAVSNMAVVGSGSYMRSYIVDGIDYNHIIDPNTLMPAWNFLSVTVIHEEVTVAEMLSTTIFILPFEEGYNLAKSFDAAAIWISSDGDIKWNEQYSRMSANFN